MLLHHEALSLYLSSPSAFRSLLRTLRRIAPFLALTLIFISLRVNVNAQTEPATDATDIIRVRTDLVTVPLFVTDRKGRRVSGLTQDDFAAQVDGVRSLKLAYFAAGTEHVALAFALDASGSAREIVGRQSEAALALFARFGPQSSVAIWHFGMRPQLVVDFTTDAELARQQFKPKAAANERTAIFDAAAAAIRAFDGRNAAAVERRILILISDGLDTASQTKAQAVINEATQRALSIYIIHLPLYVPRDGRLQPRPAAKGFRSLAEQTGGRYFMVKDSSAALDPHAKVDLTSVFKAIEEDLQGQYVLGFYPDNASRDARFHRLSINLSAPRNRNLRVRQLREGFMLKE
ncbi:MAG: VWA domain-containing protein [Pyrinomonadaceae bacterium]|nr:VWA domain-containing protein [Pyrinomonadaceae bacterium]